MITIKNYNEQVKNIDFSKLPKNVQEARTGVEDIMEFYNDDDGIKETINLYLKAINKAPLKPTIKEVAKASGKVKIVKPTRKSTRSLISSLPNVKEFMPYHQQSLLIKQNSEELDGVLLNLEKDLAKVPRKQQGENVMNSTVYAHYFYGASDWYVLDYSKTNKEFFGYVVLNGDTQMSEAGYMSIAELKENGKVELDFYFTPKKLRDILVKKYPNEFPDLEKPAPKKPSSKKQKSKKVSKKVDAKEVDRFSKEFMLIRRFFNLQKREVVSFRSVQLIYMAFQKAAVGREVRKTSKDADLFTRVNKKVVAVYDIAKPQQSNVDIQIQDKKLISEMEAYVKGSKVNYAITLLKSFIGMQGYKPDTKKVENLLKRINNAIDKGRVDKDNRLWPDIHIAKESLVEYLKKPTQKIEPEVYGLSFPKRSLCNNRIKCEGLKSNGKLKKGYKFTEGGGVAKTSSRKKKTKNKIKSLGAVLIDVSTPTPAVAVSEGTASAVPLDSTPPKTIIEKPEPAAAPKNPAAKTLAKSKNKLMAMSFDTIKMDEGWENFMQEPAANMKLAIWGKPKNGKTSGALALANYLTKHGSVYYNFVDQGFNKSTQDLWRNSGLANKNNAEPSDVDTLDELENDIKKGGYRFVVIDMINDYINKEGITPQQFKDRFIKRYPKTSFILVFEVTKNGDFKGDQGWTHVVDAIVTVENFLMENRGRYGMGEYVVWKEGLKRFNPKKYEEIFDELSLPPQMTV